MVDYSAYKFYKGEKENPFRRGTLRRAIWEWERKFEEILTSDEDESFAWWDYCTNTLKQPDLFNKVIKCFDDRRKCVSKKPLLKEYLSINFPKSAIPYLKQTRLYKGEPEDCNPYKGELNLFYDYERCWVRFNLSDKEYIDNETKMYKQFVGTDFEEKDGVPISFKAILFNRYMHWLGGYCSIEEDAEHFKEWYLSIPYHRRNYKKK